MHPGRPPTSANAAGPREPNGPQPKVSARDRIDPIERAVLRVGPRVVGLLMRETLAGAALLCMGGWATASQCGAEHQPKYPLVGQVLKLAHHHETGE